MEKYSDVAIAQTSSGKVKVRVQYYPKKSFWAFFEKKVPQTIRFLYENGDSYTLNYRRDSSLEHSKLVQSEREETANYRQDGSLERSRLLQPGREEYTEYHPNGKIASLSVFTDDYGKRISKWDAEGRPIFEYRYDPETRTEITYHPNGLVKQQHHRPTNMYKEFTEDGKLKRQGLWVSEYGDRSTPLDYTWDGSLTGGDTSLLDESYRFTTGRGEYKLQDKVRREFNERIEALMKGPKSLKPTAERKSEKETLLKSYKAASKKNIENIKRPDAKWPTQVPRKGYCTGYLHKEDGFDVRKAVTILKKARKGASKRANAVGNDSR